MIEGELHSETITPPAARAADGKIFKVIEKAKELSYRYGPAINSARKFVDCAVRIWNLNDGSDSGL